jgi:hypothetical protein
MALSKVDKNLHAIWVTHNNQIAASVLPQQLPHYEEAVDLANLEQVWTTKNTQLASPPFSKTTTRSSCTTRSSPPTQQTRGRGHPARQVQTSRSPTPHTTTCARSFSRIPILKHGSRTHSAQPFAATPRRKPTDWTCSACSCVPVLPASAIATSMASRDPWRIGRHTSVKCRMRGCPSSLILGSIRPESFALWCETRPLEGPRWRCF